MKKAKTKKKVNGFDPTIEDLSDAYFNQEFPFEFGRHLTPAELEENRKGIEALTGIPRARRGRPVKPDDEKFVAISIRIDPAVLERVKKKAKKRGIGYQTLINEALKAI